MCGVAGLDNGCALICHADVKSCGKSWLDSAYVDLVPSQVASRIPIEKTEKSGLDQHWADIMVHMISCGSGFRAICETYNKVQATSHARRKLGFYSKQLAELQESQVKFEGTKVKVGRV
jgi:hypothetical protein